MNLEQSFFQIYPFNNARRRNSIKLLTVANELDVKPITIKKMLKKLEQKSYIEIISAKKSKNRSGVENIEYSIIDKRELVTKSTAMSLLKVSYKKWDGLNLSPFRIVDNPYYKKSISMQLFLKDEILRIAQKGDCLQAV
jgi:porphobilinogen deaminase